ncbi:PelD GGDEF domain-containing protein [Alcaligenaceae bacterium]|nr:PelD GGDEF domain-containing protein [Alcaligenaceae bacterium]
MPPVTLQQKLSTERKSDFKNNVGRYGRFFAPAATWPVSVLEVVVSMGVVIGVCYVIRPGDPLLLGLGFPWVWLAATVFALRYGALIGVLAGFCISVAWQVFYGSNPDTLFPTMHFVGGLTLVIIAGHFNDVWTTRANRLQNINNYLDERLVSITNNHYLLRVSHERLEKDLLSKPSTLRDAVGYLRNLSLPNVQNESLPNAQVMLEFASLSCQIDIASIFELKDDGFSKVAMAWVGEHFELNADDPLVKESIEKQALAHLRNIDANESAYLACVPITSSLGHLKGMLVVRHMPFLSLNFDNLQLLLVLLNYYADGIEQREIVMPIQNSVPECPYEFALELGRMARMRAISSVESSLVALVFPRRTVADSLFDQVVRQHRALDLRWVFSADEIQMLVILMPLTNEAGIEGYLLRLENNLKSQFDTDLIEAKVAVHSCSVDPSNPADGLKDLLERCGYHG